MTDNPGSGRLSTGIPNLDLLLGGGVPRGTVNVFAGPPGAGKTILAEQLCFHNASPARPAVYFNTLSEPTAKTLRYLREFSFFDAAKLEGAVQFVDLGVILRGEGLAQASELILSHVKRVKPAVVVVDSFKVFDDLARSQTEIRKFGYELAVHLMAWEATTLLLGEYSPVDIATNPLFSIVDGLFQFSQREQSGELRRLLQISKMRGTAHSREEHPFAITREGIELFAPRVTVTRAPAARRDEPRLRTGIERLDDLLGEGIPRGSSVLVCGVAGTGKTVLLLETIYRGALQGEKGILFTFEETDERLRATARGLGWDLDREIERGMVELVFIPQPEIMIEAHLQLMRKRIEALRARRVAVDSVSVFLHKISDVQVGREKVFQLASIIQNANAVGFLATDIPYGTETISRFGVEETVVDGVLLLTLSEEGLERQRYLEVYKLRNTAHLKGRHNMAIGAGGIAIYPRYNLVTRGDEPPPPLELARRLPTGVPGLDELMGGGLIERSATLVSGSPGIGKTTLGLQFLLEGARSDEPGLFVALEEAPAQLLKTAEALRLPGLEEAVASGRLRVIYLSREHVRANQFLTLLAAEIQARGTRRLVFDSASYVMVVSPPESDLQQIIFALVTRFKALGVTSLLTFEADDLFFGDRATTEGVSPSADNLVQLRYARLPGELRPTLTVVKTRGSAHDRGTYFCEVARGGLRIGERADASPAAPGPRKTRPGRTKKRR